MIRTFTLALLGSLATVVAAPITYFLPAKDYRAGIPVPSAVLGHEIGEWHLRHDQLVTYLRTLADASDRIQFEEIGRTYEARPLVMLTISSPENLARLEEIRKQHLTLSDPSRQPARALEEMPVIVTMGYGVHGNEPSGSNAAPLVAYHLAASGSDDVKQLLEHAVILLDPCLNPDGFSRFAEWANTHRGKHPIASAASREHNEVWPGGRTNHYWFDLNRDWLLARHPESTARLEKFHAWRPNVLTDFHEMGSDSTYFFQPGVPARRNPLTPARNVELTERFAGLHAQALDEIGSLYFNEENFDDFYYGKGSTYPDIHGGVGILFEQASSRGHLRESIHGELDFAFTIRNQVRTSLSTLAGAAAMRGDLLAYQRQFYEDALTLAEADPVRGYVFGNEKDPASTHEMLALLRRHRIVVHSLAAELNGFSPGSAFLVPARQPQYRLVKTLFERRTEFEDSVFYDVSAWNLPLAMGVPCHDLTEIPEGVPGAPVGAPRFPAVKGPPPSKVAYAFEWHGQFAPRALNRLHAAKALAKVSFGPLSVETTDGTVALDRGAIIIPLGVQKDASPGTILRVLRTIAAKDGIVVHALTTSLTPRGNDLGSPGIHPLVAPGPVLLVGKGVDAYEAGEVWHLLDQRCDTKVNLVDLSDLSSLDLHGVTHLLMVDGKYDLSDKRVAALKEWVTSGGILIATKRAARWAAGQGIGTTHFDAAEDEKKKDEEFQKELEEAVPHRRLPYEAHQPDHDSKLTKGAIFATDLDLTHPLGFGYTRRDLAVFRDSNLIMRPSRDPYATVAKYTATPLLAGYVHPENLAKIKDSAALIAERVGSGAVISFADNPNFRAYWSGTSKAFLNALFFGTTIEKTVKLEDGEPPGHAP